MIVKLKTRSVLKCLVMYLLLHVHVATGSKEHTGTVIGIDLGTTYSCVGVYKNGRVEIFQNDQGNRITPSYVAFTSDGERLIGDAAKNQLTTNPSNTVFDVKRMIGRTWDDPAVQKDIKYWSFTVKEQNKKPYIEVSIKGTKKLFAPEEISAMVLGKMKEIAEQKLGHNVTHAVVTVPAYFNDVQRQATKDAGTIAGLNVMRIINEPTAAALAFGMENKEDDKHIIVYDLGGGTFDVSLLAIDDKVFEVKATSGNTHLGGEDFDQRVMDYFIKLYKKQTGKDVRGNNRAMQKLRREVEKAKRTISSEFQIRVEISSFVNGQDYSELLTRARFEEINKDLFVSTLKPLKQVIDDANLLKKDIDEIVLVGGSSRIPKIQQLVKDFFDGKEPNRKIHPDEAVAYGAAILAGTLSEHGTAKDVPPIIDVIPLALGTDLVGGVMAEFIPRNSKIPVKKSKLHTTVKDNQHTVQVGVYQGQRPMVKDNDFLGKFFLKGIKPAPRGDPAINITFSVDINGILTVTAKEKKGTSSGSITISTKDRNNLSSEEIDRMIEDAKKFAQGDRVAKERADSKSDLERYLNDQSRHMRNSVGKIPESQRKEIIDRINGVDNWLDTETDATAEEYRQTKRNLEEAIKEIILKQKTEL